MGETFLVMQGTTEELKASCSQSDQDGQWTCWRTLYIHAFFLLSWPHAFSLPPPDFIFSALSLCHTFPPNPKVGFFWVAFQLELHLIFSVLLGLSFINNKFTILGIHLDEFWQMYTPCNHQCNQDIEHSQQPWKSPSCPFAFNLHFYYQFHLLSFFPLIRILHKCNHTVCTLLYLISFTQPNDFGIYPCCFVYQ